MDFVQKYRIVMFFSLGQGIVIGRPLQFNEPKEVRRETGRENVLHVIGEGTMDIRFLEVVPDNEYVDMETVTPILLLEGLGHRLVVISRHMADREEVPKAPNRPEFNLPSSPSSLI